MALVSEKVYMSWTKKGHFIRSGFDYIFQNPIWKTNIPQSFSLCPYFWLSIIVGHLIIRGILVPVWFISKLLAFPVKKFDRSLGDKIVANVDNSPLADNPNSDFYSSIRQVITRTGGSPIFFGVLMFVTVISIFGLSFVSMLKPADIFIYGTIFWRVIVGLIIFTVLTLIIHIVYFDLHKFEEKRCKTEIYPLFGALVLVGTTLYCNLVNWTVGVFSGIWWLLCTLWTEVICVSASWIADVVSWMAISIYNYFSSLFVNNGDYNNIWLTLGIVVFWFILAYFIGRAGIASNDKDQKGIDDRTIIDNMIRLYIKSTMRYDTCYGRSLYDWMKTQLTKYTKKEFGKKIEPSMVVIEMLLSDFIEKAIISEKINDFITDEFRSLSRDDWNLMLGSSLGKMRKKYLSAAGSGDYEGAKESGHPYTAFVNIINLIDNRIASRFCSLGNNNPYKSKRKKIWGKSFAEYKYVVDSFVNGKIKQIDRTKKRNKACSMFTNSIFKPTVFIGTCVGAFFMLIFKVIYGTCKFIWQLISYTWDVLRHKKKGFCPVINLGDK